MQKNYLVIQNWKRKIEYINNNQKHLNRNYKLILLILFVFIPYIYKYSAKLLNFDDTYKIFKYY